MMMQAPDAPPAQPAASFFNLARLKTGLKKYGRTGIYTYLGLSTCITACRWPTPLLAVYGPHGQSTVRAQSAMPHHWARMQGGHADRLGAWASLVPKVHLTVHMHDERQGCMHACLHAREMHFFICMLSLTAPACDWARDKPSADCKDDCGAALA